MSISPLITGGFGSFSGVQFLPTLGFGLGAANENTDQEAGLTHYPHRPPYPRWEVIGDKVHMVQSEAQADRLQEDYENSLEQNKPQKQQGKKARQREISVTAESLQEIGEANRLLAQARLEAQELEDQRIAEQVRMQAIAYERNMELQRNWIAMQAQMAADEEEEALILLMAA